MLINVFCIIALIFSCNKLQSQSKTVTTGTVMSFATVLNKDSIPVLIDTIVGQHRTVTIDTTARKISIMWHINNDSVMVNYNIEDIYQTESHYVINNKPVMYLNMIAFDQENYPVLVSFPIDDLNYLFFYYYWSDKEKIFQKSEKVKITSNKNIEKINLLKKTINN